MYNFKKPLINEDWWVIPLRLSIILSCAAFFVALCLFPWLWSVVAIGVAMLAYHLHRAPIMAYEYDVDTTEHEPDFLEHVREQERFRAAVGDPDPTPGFHHA